MKGEVNSAFMADSGSRKSLHFTAGCVDGGTGADAERFSDIPIGRVDHISPMVVIIPQVLAIFSFR